MNRFWRHHEKMAIACKLTGDETGFMRHMDRIVDIEAGIHKTHEEKKAKFEALVLEERDLLQAVASLKQRISQHRHNLYLTGVAMHDLQKATHRLSVVQEDLLYYAN